MRAVVLHEIGKPENVRVEEVPTPQPGAGEVRVRLEASALNRRDVWITVGAYPRIRLPSISGSDGEYVLSIQRCRSCVPPQKASFVQAPW